jgi:hypothetical protein
VTESAPRAAAPSGPWRFYSDNPRLVDRFEFLLIITIAAVVTLALVGVGIDSDDIVARIGAGLVTVFVGVTLLLSLRASGVSNRFRLIADVLVGLGLLGTIGALLLGVGDPAGASGLQPPLVWVLLSVVAPVVVTRRVLQHRKTTVQTLMGAVAGYLLIAVAFALIYLWMDQNVDDPFFGTQQPSTSFMYFSLVTVTTTGYGDLAAVAPPSRLFATMEAVVGQVYLVTFVAMVVGRLVEQQARPSGTEPRAAAEDAAAIQDESARGGRP